MATALVSCLRRFGLALFLGLCTLTAFAADQVIYHIDDADAQATKALRNLRNHLDVSPNTKIIVVTHGPGIDFLLDGAENMAGQKFSPAIGELAGRGVEFKVCNNTLVSRKIPKENVIMEAKVVPSGVAEVATLQAKEKFVYLRP